MSTSPLPSTSTLSKDPRLFGVGFHPTTIREGHGPRVLGDDGHWYVDYICGLGSLLLGHGHPEFCERMSAQVWKGINYSMVDSLESVVAEKFTAYLSPHVPGWRDLDLGVRFVLSGSEGCEAAVRLARAATGRQWCLSTLYHGWHSMFTGLTPPAHGVVPDPYMAAFPWGDLDILEAMMSRLAPVACVILEVPPQEPFAGYLPGVRALCDKYGALLIIDEVVTGFRVALGGASEYYNVRPDVAVYAKAISNGVPFGAIVGDRALFEHFNLPSPVFVSGTALGNSLSLAACNAVLDIWNQDGVDHLWQVGGRLKAGLAEAGYRVEGQAPRFLVQFSTPAERAYWIVGMRDRSVLANRPMIICLAHTLDDVGQTVAAAVEIRQEMDRLGPEGVACEMAGKLPQVLFSNR